MKFATFAIATSCCAALVSAFVDPSLFASTQPMTAEQQVEVQQLLSALQAPRRGEVLGCWKQIFHREPELTTCPEGMELSGPTCYPRCNEGYRGFGPYCLRDSPKESTELTFGRQSYERGSGQHRCSGDVIDNQCLTPCGSGFATVGSVCAASECPASLPFTCGIFCTKNAMTCTKEVADVTTLGYKIIVDVQSGNWPAAIMNVKKLFEKLKEFPPCDQIEGKQANVLGQVIQMLQSIQTR